MSILGSFINFVLHIDKHLSVVIQQFGGVTYAILFLIIFAETGFVLMPFLPGDSLLFTAGAFAAIGSLNVYLVLALLALAAILGDSMNYWIGYHLGPKVFQRSRFFKREHLEKTKEFYQKHGKKTIILARFMPMVRTFAPFVAGIGAMDYSLFLLYNIIGGIIWVCLFVLGGYFFGNLAWVQENFSLVILGIIILSLLPAMTEILKHRLRRERHRTKKR